MSKPTITKQSTTSASSSNKIEKPINLVFQNHQNLINQGLGSPKEGSLPQIVTLDEEDKTTTTASMVISEVPLVTNQPMAAYNKTDNTLTVLSTQPISSTVVGGPNTIGSSVLFPGNTSSMSSSTSSNSRPVNILVAKKKIPKTLVVPSTSLSSVTSSNKPNNEATLSVSSLLTASKESEKENAQLPTAAVVLPSVAKANESADVTIIDMSNDDFDRPKKAVTSSILGFVVSKPIVVVTTSTNLDTSDIKSIQEVSGEVNL